MPGEIEREDVGHQASPGDPVSVVGRTGSKEFVKVTFIPQGPAGPGISPPAPGSKTPRDRRD